MAPKQKDWAAYQRELQAQVEKMLADNRRDINRQAFNLPPGWKRPSRARRIYRWLRRGGRR
jgi:hypothetical protein